MPMKNFQLVLLVEKKWVNFFLFFVFAMADTDFDSLVVKMTTQAYLKTTETPK